MEGGYKHKTGVFGTDSEHYTSQLFLMFRNLQGSRRPDLISLNGRFNPKLSIEVKSGRNRKGVMVDYQLHYAITTNQDYEDTFGEEFTARNGTIPGLEKALLPTGYIAYYYDIVDRADKLKASDLKAPFSAIKIRWGDQFMVPHEFGFFSFAINMAKRSGDSVQEVILYLKEMMQRDVIGEKRDYYDRKSEKNSWQDLHGRDILAIFQNDPKIATEQGKQRIERMHDYYPELRNLRRVVIPGPNRTTIYILTKPEDFDLINNQLRAVIKERKPILERITGERAEAETLLERIKMSAFGLYENGELPNKEIERIDLSPEEIIKLKRLARWMTAEEMKAEEELPF